MYSSLVDLIRSIYNTPQGYISLHEPRFFGNEKKYVLDCIDSTFVSSSGKYVDRVGELICEITGAKYAVPIVNGTCALHLSLVVAGVKRDDEVLTQPLTFVATSNAISYTGATPHFVDVDRETMGMSPTLLKNYLREIAEIRTGSCYNKKTGKRISACLPMHSFGLPLFIDDLAEVCAEFNIVLIEDAAESIGTTYKGKHTGRFGKMGTFSFNGNKTVTSGGGGAIITDDATIATQLKHLSTQAKIPHKYEYNHDQIGYNYRIPNINAALACAQLEQLDAFVKDKREIAETYHHHLEKLTGISSIKEISSSFSNYWLNAVMLNSRQKRDEFLEYMSSKDIMVRPVWNLMNHLEMFKQSPSSSLENSEFLADRVVNIPSSVRIKK